MAALTFAARAYQSSFDARPHTTLAITGGALNALGDVVAQATHNILRDPHEKYIPFDPSRTFRFFVFGASISPFLGRWNLFLEKHFPLRGRQGGISMGALAKRVACDQVVMAPIGLVAFIGSMGMMEGRSRKQISQKYQDLFVPTLRTNWTVWPAIQFINFRFMPLAYRIPFQSTCGVFWTLYLSTVNSQEDRKQDTQTELRRTLNQ